MSDAGHDSDPQDPRLEEILHDYLRAVDAGRAPDQGELLRRHPEFAAELHAFFADQERADRLAHAMRQEQPGSPLGFLLTSAGPDPAAGAPAPGARIQYFGDYELLGEVARGAMGVVYKARQISLNRVVALKMILAGELASPAAVQRFRTEAENAANLDHPHIVSVYEVGEHQGRHYFSMKLIAGTSLAQQVPRLRDDPRAAARLLAAAARAVHHAHQRGILHRDLKPGNILVDERGEPHVTDFGLAKRVEGDARLTQSGAIVGTPSYMAPEQARSEEGLTTAVDVYGLGAVLYELLTGRPPFRAATPLDTVLQVLDREPARPRSVHPGADRDLETVCLKCLDKDPARRYGSARELAEELERWLRGEPIAARPAGPRERAWRWCRRNPVVASLLAMLFGVLLLGSVVSSLLAWRSATSAELAREKERQAIKEQLAAEKARRNAETEKRNAESARNDARAEKARAEAQRDRAERLFHQAEWAFNRAQLKQAYKYWHEKRPAEAINTLNSCRWDFRGWEHRFLWTLAQTRPHAQTQEVFTMKGHTGPVICTAFSPDGKYIASATRSSDGLRNSEEGSGEIKIWDTSSGHQVGNVRMPAVTSLAFSPDGVHLVASGGIGGRDLPCSIVVILDTRKKKVVRELKGYKGLACCVAYSPDGKTVVAGCEDGSAVLWDAATGNRIRKFVGHAQPVTSVAYSSDGKLLATGDGDIGLGVLVNDGSGRKVKIMIRDAATGKIQRSLKIDAARVASIGFSRDGKRLVTGLWGEAVVWDVLTGKKEITIPDVGRVLLSPQGDRILGGDERGNVKAWESSSG